LCGILVGWRNHIDGRSGRGNGLNDRIAIADDVNRSRRTRSKKLFEKMRRNCLGFDFGAWTRGKLILFFGICTAGVIQGTFIIDGHWNDRDFTTIR
jgi:hypothetical protein